MPTNCIFLKTFNSEFSYTEVLKCKIYKIMRYSVQPRDQIFVKGYGYFSFAKDMGKTYVKT